jgi:pimeloyl-ACP methyl ester carboxylesterase
VKKRLLLYRAMGTARRRALAGICPLVTMLAGAQGASAESAVEGPPGTNNFGCQPSAAHPDPVVLVHGLGASAPTNWAYIGPRLVANGYCVFALSYGRDPRTRLLPYRPGGTIPIEQSSAELKAFVDRVLGATGAAKVDLVGHFEGTVMPRSGAGPTSPAPRSCATSRSRSGSPGRSSTWSRASAAPARSSSPDRRI